MTDHSVHWAAVSSAYRKDLDLLTEAALRGDDSPTPSGSVREAADRLAILIETLRALDDTNEKNVAAIEAVLFYIGWSAGVVSAQLPITVRPRDIQVAARDIIDLIGGHRSLEQVLKDAGDDI